MGLNIKNAEAEANIRALAKRTGESLTDAIDNAVREKLDRIEAVPRSRNEPPLLERLKPLLDLVEAERKAKGDTRTSKEALDELYDDDGFPA